MTKHRLFPARDPQFHGGRGPSSARRLSYPISLPARHWRALNHLALEHGCNASEIFEGLLNTHLNNFAAKLPQHLEALRGKGG